MLFILHSRILMHILQSLGELELPPASMDSLGRWTDSWLFNHNPPDNQTPPPEKSRIHKGLLTTGVIARLWRLTPMPQVCILLWCFASKPSETLTQPPHKNMFAGSFPNNDMTTEGHEEILKYGSGHFDHFRWWSEPSSSKYTSLMAMPAGL